MAAPRFIFATEVLTSFPDATGIFAAYTDAVLSPVIYCNRVDYAKIALYRRKKLS